MTSEEAVALLLERRLLAPRDFVLGEVSVTDRSARNHNIRVTSTTRSGCFLKQSDAGDLAAPLAAEASVYQYADSAPEFDGLRPYLPRLLFYDEAMHLLVLELCEGCVTAREAIMRGGGPPAAFGSRLGIALSACHSVGRAPGLTGVVLPRMVPWAFHLAFPTPALFQHLSPLQLTVLRIMQRQPNVIARLRELRAAWSWQDFMHGDVRWENVLLPAEGAAPATAQLRLVDWEAAGWGDAAWDVGCAFQCWLAHSIETLRIEPDDDPMAASARFAEALPGATQSIREFWKAYVRECRLSAEEAVVFRDRATSYCALRLLQAGFEWARLREGMTTTVLCSLQLGLNLLALTGVDRAGILGLEQAELATA